MNCNVVKGTRDFLPSQMNKRNYIFSVIEKVYKAHGFVQIETPALESLSTLMGKYGEEGDKLLYKVLDSGEFLSDKVSDSNKGKHIKTFEEFICGNQYAKAASMISEKGLRYDLTVPFARFVVAHRNDITFPFKRYQIQPVWRADRPQKGRYREFYQCDCDIIGSNSLLNEVELLQIIDEVFSLLNLKVQIKLNNRKILAAIAQMIGQEDKLTDITVCIDKLDKIGFESVCSELKERGLSEQDIKTIEPILHLEGSSQDKISKLKEIFSQIEIGQKGLEELESVLSYAQTLNLRTPIDFDITLARGLNYYTGALVEVKCEETAMGSITGGGRYDNLTGIFGLKDVSGVGISFGADRIYDCLETLERFPKDIDLNTQVIFLNFGDKEVSQCLLSATELRQKNVLVEVYPEGSKLQKQMKYANDKHVPYVVMIGQRELETGDAVVKNMTSGEQSNVSISELTDYLCKALEA